MPLVKGLANGSGVSLHVAKLLAGREIDRRPPSGAGRGAASEVMKGITTGGSTYPTVMFLRSHGTSPKSHHYTVVIINYTIHIQSHDPMLHIPMEVGPEGD